jgi:hypothetical protein
VLLAVIIGLNWRVGVVSLGIVTASSWLLALGYGIYLGLDSTVPGVIALVVAAAALFAWRAPREWHSASTATPS